MFLFNQFWCINLDSGLITSKIRHWFDKIFDLSFTLISAKISTARTKKFVKTLTEYHKEIRWNTKITKEKHSVIRGNSKDKFYDLNNYFNGTFIFKITQPLKVPNHVRISFLMLLQCKKNVDPNFVYNISSVHKIIFNFGFG